MRVLNYESCKQRKEAIQVARAQLGDEAFQVAMPSIWDPDAEVRTYALIELTAVNDARFRPIMLDRLQSDFSPRARSFTVGFLCSQLRPAGGLGAARVSDMPRWLLGMAMGDPSDMVRNRAIEEVSRVTGASAAEWQLAHELLRADFATPQLKQKIAKEWATKQGIRDLDGWSRFAASGWHNVAKAAGVLQQDIVAGVQGLATGPGAEARANHIVLEGIIATCKDLLGPGSLRASNLLALSSWYDTTSVMDDRPQQVCETLEPLAAEDLTSPRNRAIVSDAFARAGY